MKKFSKILKTTVPLWKAKFEASLGNDADGKAQQRIKQSVQGLPGLNTQGGGCGA